MVSHGFLLPTRLSVMASDGAPTLTAKTQSDVVGLAQRAEAAGFDSVWVGDSVLAKPRHEPLSTLAAIAGATEAVELGTAVYLPALRDPVNVAHLTATVDQLSGGRLHLGIGTGSVGKLGSSVNEEYREMGVPWEKRGALLDEQLDVIKGLWTGDSLEYDGEFYSYDGASIGFEPVREPPIYVGSSVDSERGVLKAIRERIATRGDGWFPGMASPEEFEFGLDQIERTVRKTGGDPGGLDTLYYQDVVIADSEAEAFEKERAFLREYYPGLEEQTDEQLRKRGTFGSAEKVKERMKEYEEAGVEHIVTRFPATNQHEQFERFTSLIH